MAQKNDPSAALNANTIHTHIHSNIFYPFSNIIIIVSIASLGIEPL
jgi:hypothetical protein